MKVTLVVAYDLNRGIGYRGRMPWHIPRDLKHFKAVTWGYPAIIGRRTYESSGKVLPGRHWIVLSRQPGENIPGRLTWVRTPEEALQVAQQIHPERVMVAGGSEIYRLFLPVVTDAYLTLIHDTFPADTFFPEDLLSSWEVVQQEEVPAGADTPVPLTFYYLKRP